VFLPLWLGGCYGVYSDQLVGDKPVVLVSDEWEGTWIHKDGAVTVAVTNKSHGLLQVGWVEKKQGNLEFESYRVELRQSGQWVFGNVRDPEQPKRVLWARVRKEGNQVTLWIPDRARFEEMVRQRQIEGKVDTPGEDVMLIGFGPETVGRLLADHGLPLQWDEPLVFQRLAR